MSSPSPSLAEPLTDVLTRVEIRRRDALKLLGAGIALAKAGCMQAPGEEVLPYAHKMPELSPGAPLWYATSIVLDGYATGVVVESHEGRPTKIEGNPAHPASLGGTSAIQQASILDLYDPDRARVVELAGMPSSWARLAEQLGALPPGPLWLVLPPQSSPLVAGLIARIREGHPGTRVVYHAPLGRGAAYRGAVHAFGAPLEVQLDLTRADVVVALDADLLGAMHGAVRWARDFAARRHLDAPTDTPVRLYAIEPMVTPTGSLADHRLAAPARDVLPVATALLSELGRRGRPVPPLPPVAASVGLPPERLRWVRAVADDLIAHAGRSAVVVGDRQPAACHALGHWINAAVGALGATVRLTAAALDEPLGDATLADLAAAARAGQIGTAAVLDCNPVYASPPALAIEAALRAVPLTVHATPQVDETSRACQWTAPLAHYLEAWGDARALDGTVSFVQPLIRPLYGSPSTVEILAALAGLRGKTGRALLREPWRPRLAAAGPAFDQAFERAWTAALGDGFLAGTAAPALPATPTAALPAALVAELDRVLAPPADDRLELALAGSPAVHDGRFADNAWLQELPQPMTSLTWSNALLVSPRLADRLDLADGTVVRIRSGDRTLLAPALRVPGHADGSVTLELGYGRRAPDQPIADGVGVDGFALLGADGALIVPAVDLAATGQRRRLARTQLELDDHGRDLALAARLDDYRRDPDFTREHRGPLPSLLPVPERTGLQWAMTIDTTICTGCSACVIACQAENNVPVVGADGVRRGRAMHWLRIDRYVARERVVHQPMLCQHCEMAPCEYVCPVYATSHSPDGLNEMTYNRCVGTRFCSNNCPYKVRRFNWFHYNRPETTAALQHNPDVTVRDRGVMEKCTYCVQRIRGAEIQARMERRDVRPGEVVTACQQACPTGAIQFGALGHADTPMVKWRQQPRAYAVLHDLGTRPRTMYLAAIRNPNPALDNDEDEP